MIATANDWLAVLPALALIVGEFSAVALGTVVRPASRQSFCENTCYLALILMRERPTPALLWLMVVSQGALGYGLTSVVGAIPAEIFQGRHYGGIFGTLMLSAIFGGAAGPWVTGALYDVTGSYTPAFWIAIGLNLMSAAAIWRAAPRKVRAVAGRIPAIAAVQDSSSS